MSKYRKIDPRIWNDQKFCDLSDNGQLLFLFVLTHPHMTALGAMRATLDGLAAEKGWAPKAFREAFVEASSKGLLRADEKACFIWAPKFLKYNGPESPNVVKSWAGSLDALPECESKAMLIREVFEQLKALPKAFGEALPKGFAEALSKAMPNQEQEQEQEQEQDLLSSSSDDGEQDSRAAKASPRPTRTTSPEEVMALWNASSARSKVRNLTTERRRKVLTRLKDPAWPWKEAISLLPIPNHAKFRWQPSFDWLIENGTNANAIVEGKYDRDASPHVGTATKFNPEDAI